MRIAVETVLRSLSWSSSLPWAPSFRCWTRLIEPRLQTAISLSLVFSVISVQRLLECTTPTCCCGERTLQASLKVIQGWPVSKSIESILRQRSVARTFLMSLISPRSTMAFVAGVRRLEVLADEVVQVRAGGGREERPLPPFHHALHEQVGNPVRRVHVVGAAAVVAGVLAQLQEFFQVQVPGFEIGADGALALAALVHRHRGVIDHLQEGHYALALAVGALDVAIPALAQGSSRCPGRRRT